MADVETKDIITAIGIGLTFAATVWNLLYTLSSNKKTRFINTVTSARIDWIQRLRGNISRYAGLAHHWSVTPIPDRETARKIQEESDVLRQEIRLQLNPYDQADLRLMALVEEIPKYTDPTLFQEMKVAIENLVGETQKRLKEEWDRVKKEAKGEL
jgi:hypothetical protein